MVISGCTIIFHSFQHAIKYMLHNAIILRSFVLAITLFKCLNPRGFFVKTCFFFSYAWPKVLPLLGAVLNCCCLLFHVRNTCFWLFWNFLLILFLSHSFCLFRKDSLAGFRSWFNLDNLDSNVRSLVLRNHFLCRYSIFFCYFVPRLWNTGLVSSGAVLPREEKVPL